VGSREGFKPTSRAWDFISIRYRGISGPHRQEMLDTRKEYGEERWIVLGRVDEWTLVVVYTFRGSNLRLISARKADRNDYRIYWH